MNRTLVHAFGVVGVSLTLCACGGGGGSDPPKTNTPPPDNTPTGDPPSTGTFMDGPVEGINFKTATQSGTTDTDGHYSYVAGETVIFSVGGINFPSVTASQVVTPLDMIAKTDLADPTVVNILRLLQSLDKDGDASNGIQIAPAAHTAATGLSISFSSATFETDVANLVANSGSVTTALIDATTAVNHFKQTLSAQSIDWTPYFHYANNRQWNYTLTTGGPQNIYEYVVEGTANGKPVYIHGWDPIWDSSGTLEYVLKDMTNGPFWVGFRESGMDHFFSTPTLIGCAKLYESCSLQGSLDGMNYDFTWISELATVTVPAGTYNDCIKTTQTDNLSGEVRHEWKCRDVGIAKSDKVGSFVYELTSISTYNP